MFDALRISPLFTGIVCFLIVSPHLLSQSPDFSALKTVTLDGHTHGSAVTASFRQGMAWVFPDPEK